MRKAPDSGAFLSGAAAGEEAAEEFLGLRSLGVDQDLFGAALFDDPALVEEGDRVGDLAGEAHLVGGDQHGHPLLLEVADRVENITDQFRVESAGHLVQQQGPGSAGQGPGQGDPLLLAT